MIKPSGSNAASQNDAVAAEYVVSNKAASKPMTLHNNHLRYINRPQQQQAYTKTKETLLETLLIKSQRQCTFSFRHWMLQGVLGEHRAGS